MSKIEDIVRGAYAALAVGDVPSVLAIMAPDVRWTEAEGGPYGGLSVGPQAVLENVFMKLGGEWDGFSAVPVEYLSNATAGVALGHYSAPFKATGKSFRAPFVHVWRFAGDTVTSFEQHTDTVLHRRPMEA